MEVKSTKDLHNLIQLAENGNTSAMNDLAIYFRDGLVIEGANIVEVDEKQLFHWIKRSFELGDVEGMVSYADWISDPDVEELQYDPEKAIEIYKEAISKGAHHAYHNLGIEYRNRGEYEEAFKCYCQAGNTKESHESLSIGLCHYYGIGTLQDRNRALKIFSNLEQENCTAFELNEANYLLGKMYLEGEVVKKDINKAREYLELANEDNDHRSALELLFVIGRIKKM